MSKNDKKLIILLGELILGVGIGANICGSNMNPIAKVFAVDVVLDAVQRAGKIVEKGISKTESSTRLS